LKKREIKFIFMDKEEIKLVDTVGFFITMNPGMFRYLSIYFF